MIVISTLTLVGMGVSDPARFGTLLNDPWAVFLSTSRESPWPWLAGGAGLMIIITMIFDLMMLIRRRARPDAPEMTADQLQRLVEPMIAQMRAELIAKISELVCRILKDAEFKTTLADYVIGQLKSAPADNGPAQTNSSLSPPSIEEAMVSYGQQLKTDILGEVGALGDQLKETLADLIYGQIQDIQAVHGQTLKAELLAEIAMRERRLKARIADILSHKSIEPNHQEKESE